MKTYKVIGNDAYLITDKHEVLRVDGFELDLLTTDTTITIPLYTHNRVVDKEWLYWLSYFKLELPVQHRHRVFDYRFKEHGLLTHYTTHPRIVTLTKPIYIDGANKYRLIPQHPKYAINERGIMRNIRLSEDLSTNTPQSKGYSSISIFDSARGKIVTFSYHRLVASAWIDNDDYVKKPIVDHIDGNKSNCHVSNLRWVSYEDNAKFMFANGLRPDNYFVTTRNINTGDVKEHISLTQAAEFMGRSRINTQHTKLDPTKIWKGRNGEFELKLGSDDRPWYYLTKKVRPPILNKSSIKATIDGVVTTYTSIRGASIALLKRDRLMTARILKELFYNKYPKGKIDITVGVTIQAKHKDSDKVYEATSVMKLIDKLDTNISKSSVNKYITNGKCYEGWLFRYKPEYDNIPWGTCSDTTNVNKRVSVVVTDTLTNKETTHNSLREVARYFKVDRKTITSVIESGNMLNDRYKIKYN